MFEITFRELQELLTEAAELGAKAALAQSGHLKPMISKSEAYRIYKRGKVDRWIREGLVVPVKDGINSSTMRIDRIQIDTVAKTSNRISWYNNHDQQV